VPTTPTRVNRELLLDFFLTFSRFEYALKAAGFFRRSRRGRYDSRRTPDAEPDWNSFAVSLQPRFQTNANQRLRIACEYLLDSPPWKQVIVNGTVAWEPPGRPRGESNIEFLLRMVRCVRNNLFHGGKHNIAVHETRERTERLLDGSLIILKECLSLAPRVKSKFDQAII